MRRPCIVGGCPRIATSGARCVAHERQRDRARGTRQARGYGADHQRARAELATTLPAPCWYCGVQVAIGQRWVAAHVVDGDASSPRVVAHPRCNEQAKRLGVGYTLGPRRPSGPAMTCAHSAAKVAGFPAGSG